MPCYDCNTPTEFGEHHCSKCYVKVFCAMCDQHVDRVGPLRTRLGNRCCDGCYSKFSTLEKLKKEDIEMETISIVAENPAYLTDLINGWWSDGYKYYFAIQNQIYAADDIPMDIDEFKRAITFDTIDAEMCGYIRGTTVIWA